MVSGTNAKDDEQALVKTSEQAPKDEDGDMIVVVMVIMVVVMSMR